MRKALSILIMICTITVFSQSKKIDLEGVIVDEFEMTIPYAAITIEGTSVGTSSTDEGGFYLSLSESDLEGVILVSSMGFESTQIGVKDFLALEQKVIVLKEIVTSLSNIDVKNADYYIRQALDKLKENTVSNTHMLKMLYRRASIEDNQAKFLVEHYMKVLDKGPSSSSVKKIEVAQVRKSADYRIAKDKQHDHAINYMVKHNPLRTGFALGEFEWERIGDSSYDGEDVVIIEGRKGKNNFRRFYIGFDTYKIYKVETSISNAVFIYKKNAEGKLYLSYHNRAWNQPRKKKLEESTRKLMGKNAPESIMVAFRQEVYVLGIEIEKKKMQVKLYPVVPTDMGDVQVKYDFGFWRGLSVPPDTEFFKKIKKELEESYGVPLEKQFQYANRM